MHSEAELSRLTDTPIIGNNSLHLMHSMWPKMKKTTKTAFKVKGQGQMSPLFNHF